MFILFLVYVINIFNYGFGEKNDVGVNKRTKISEWIDLENNRNGIKARSNNSLATFSEFPKKYRPGADPYELRLYSVAKEACQVFRSHSPNPMLEKAYLSKDRISFPVHPVNLDNPKIPHISRIASEKFKKEVVSPTSSTRTVYVMNDALPSHCLKPHTDLKITRWRRHMEARKVKHAIAVTRIFEESDVFSKDPKIAYYPESLGAVYGGGNREDWGFIVREMESKPSLKEPCRMIPLCSLYNNDLRKPDETPLVVEMINQSGKDPEQYLLNELIFPLIGGWAKIYLETGVLLEAHGQNVIVEIDADTGKIIRFAHRDFDCEINSDIAVRSGFDLSDMNPNDLFTTQGNEHDPRGAHLSIIFDNSMQVPLDELAEIGSKYFSIPKTKLQKACSEYLYREFPALMQDHFPVGLKAFNYERVEGRNVIAERTQPPIWR